MTPASGPLHLLASHSSLVTVPGVVTISLPTQLAGYTNGQRRLEVPAGTLAEVFAGLAVQYPDLVAAVLADGQLHRFVNVYVDDDDVRYLEQLDTKVPDGATVSILPAVAGGCGR